MYIIQEGEIELLAGGIVVDTCRANDTIGVMSVIDGGERTLTARTKLGSELSVVDKKKFHFMIDEVPNFAFYIMEQMAKRMRGLGHAN